MEYLPSDLIEEFQSDSIDQLGATLMFNSHFNIVLQCSACSLPICFKTEVEFRSHMFDHMLDHSSQ